MIQGVADKTLDFSRLPRPEQSETRLIVIGGTGRVTLRDQETGYVSALNFDAVQFPFVMLWISNRGRAAAPWPNRHLALGVEPVRAAFDLGSAMSASSNPLTALGHDTAFDLTGDTWLHTAYTITAQSPSTDVC